MTPNPTAPLDEVRVADATGSVAVIYGGLTRWSGVPIPALLYRHLASRPPYLDWVWETVGPRLKDGSLQAAARLQYGDGSGAPVSLPAMALEAAGVSQQEQATVRAIIATYNRMNPINLLAISVCRHAMETTAALPAHEAAQVEPPDMLPDIPAAIALETMSPALRALTEELSGYVPQSINGAITPTLYRHLARWPGLMAIAGAQLLPRLRAGQIQQQAASLAPWAAAQVKHLPPTRAAWPLDALAQRDLGQMLDPFFTLIPQLIVVGQLLKAGMCSPALAEPEAPLPYGSPERSP